MDLWIVGAGGLLGSALLRGAPSSSAVFRTPGIPWADPEAAGAALRRSLQEFARRRTASAPWAIVWAAGTGVPASTAAELAVQQRVLLDFAAAARRELDSTGAFLFASSASVFGIEGGEFDETTPARPVGGYATAKWEQEVALRDEFAGPTGPGLVLARISTLYGTGQNLAKKQGLVSSMCLEAVRGGTIHLYVPLDTVRDYLYADDAAAMCFALLDRAFHRAGDEPLLRVLASHRTTTVGELAQLVQSVAHRRTHIIQAAAPEARPHHLAVRSIDPSIAGLARTPLAAGVNAVHKDVLRRHLAPR